MEKKETKRFGGRQKGTPNIATRELKAMIDHMLPPAEIEKRWKKFLNSIDEKTAYKAFEMALHYRYGKPIQVVMGQEDLPPVKIDISAIPVYHEKIQ